MDYFLQWSCSAKPTPYVGQKSTRESLSNGLPSQQQTSLAEESLSEVVNDVRDYSLRIIQSVLNAPTIAEQTTIYEMYNCGEFYDYTCLARLVKRILEVKADDFFLRRLSKVSILRAKSESGTFRHRDRGS